MKNSQMRQGAAFTLWFLKAAFLMTFSLFVWSAVLCFVAWAFGAIYYLEYLPVWLRVPSAYLYALGAVWLLGWSWKNKKLIAGRGWLAVSIPVVYLFTLGVVPSNDRDWDADQVQIASVSIHANNVTIENFRNSVYRSESDFDTRFETRTFDLNRIRASWFLVQRFVPTDGLAHVLLSFELSPLPDEGGSIGAPEYVCLSIEIRRELGETYGPIKGLFKVYELAHIIGDERDLIGVRTVFRPHDRVFLYRLHATPEQSRELFVRLADRIAKLERSPEFYHSLLNNCANGITRQTYEMTETPIRWFDPRVVLPGYSSELAYELELIGDKSGGQTLEMLQAESRIDERAREVGITESFSQDIRTRRATASIAEKKK